MSNMSANFGDVVLRPRIQDRQFVALALLRGMAADRQKRGAMPVPDLPAATATNCF